MAIDYVQTFYKLFLFGVQKPKSGTISEKYCPTVRSHGNILGGGKRVIFFAAKSQTKFCKKKFMSFSRIRLVMNLHNILSYKNKFSL